MVDPSTWPQQLRAALQRRLRVDGLFWRKLAWAGIEYGPEPWLRYSPPAFGVAFWAAIAPLRQNVRQSLRRLHGPRPAPIELAESAAVFANFASCLTEAILVGTDRGYRASVISANDGLDFKTSQAEGRGVILATAHTAGWDVAGPMLTDLQPAEVIVVMAPEEEARARAMQDEARHKAGVRVVHAGDDPLAALPLLRHLRKDKGIVAMKFDRSVPGMRTREVRFLGAPWRVPEGLFTLAAVSGAPVMPVFTRRLGFLRYEFITAPPFHISRRPDDAELDAAAQRLADLLEDFARDNPAQWFNWMV